MAVITKKAIDHLIYFFEEQVLLFKSLSKKTSQHATTKNVHDLRVNVRRLRVILWLLEYKDVDKPLKQLKNVLGEQRALDVMLDLAKTYELNVNQLEKEIAQAKKITKSTLTQKHRQEILKPLYKITTKLAKHPTLHFENRLFILKCHVNSWLHGSISNDELHPFRISLKKLRYAYEALGKPVSTFKKVQDRLGEAHDFEELRRRYKKETSHKPQILQRERILKARALELARKSFSH